MPVAEDIAGAERVEFLEPKLLVELPSWWQVFSHNLREFVLPPKLPPLKLTSAPAPFWPDVFVSRPVAWRRFFESAAYHIAALALLAFVAPMLATRTTPAPQASFDHDQVVYYQPSEYLPPLDTLRADDGQPAKADPVPSPQPILSVPPEADNHRQTIVTPPNVNLKRDVSLPNVVAWQEKPTMPIAPAPLVPAASLARLNPELDNAVVAPPPDARSLTRRRDALEMQTSVVAPPPDLTAAANTGFQTPQTAVIAPPPNVDALSTRRNGDINIGHSAVIAPAPQLSLAEQRAMSGSRGSSTRIAAQVVPPPPSLGAGGKSGSTSSRGTSLVALSVHPAIGAPPAPPEGNRRGTFAASPNGKVGASGAPGSASGTAGTGAGNNGKGPGSTSNAPKNDSLPAGLYVGPATQPASSVAGNSASGHDSVNPNLIANARPPRINTPSSRTLQPGDESRLSEAERQVFAGRRFYSLTLNMPNLNSAGGSWVIRFAEKGHSDPKAKPSASLSAPEAVRKVDPAYPLQLMRENVTGTVILYAVIRSDGSVGDVRVLRSVDDRIDQFASQAVAQWQFAPATKNGSPVDVEATFQIPFRPARGF